MQDMFPFPVTVSGNVSTSAKGAKTKRPDANKFDAKKPNAAGDGARRNDVKNATDSARQPFESVLNQAEGAELAAKPEKGTRQIDASPLDTQSAASFRDENQLPNAEKAEVSDILNAIGNLLSPLSANQGGVDPSFISDEVSIALGELLTAIPGSENDLGGGSDVYQQNTELLNGNDLDVARLESMLALMKNRAPADTPDAPAPAGDSPRSLDRAAIIDLTASFLQNLQAKATERKHGHSEPSDASDAKISADGSPDGVMSAYNPLLTDAKHDDILGVSDADKGDAQVQLISRFSAYLKDNFAEKRADLTEKTRKFTSFDARSSALKDSDLLNAAALQAAERNNTDTDLSNSTSPSPDPQVRGSALSGQPDAADPKKEASASAVQDKTKGYEDKATPEVEDERGGAAARPDRGVNFEQFMSGITRARTDATHAPMELSHGTPLSRNEALREGLDNVVRFVRVSGEQRASMIIDPPALGRIIVELNATAAGLEASIKVSSEQVRQLIQEELSQLRYSLAQQGVELTQFSVDVQQDDGQNNRDAEQQSQRQRVSMTETDEQDEEAGFRVDLNQGLLYWVG